jgi:hypothetical protein
VTIAGLYRYIDGAKIVQPDGAVTWAEVTFTEAEPNVESIVTEGVGTLQVAHVAAILRRSEFLNTNEGLTVQQRAEEIEKIAQKAEDYHFATQRAQLKSNAMTQHAAWTAHTDKYDKDCKELSLQFLRSIEASTLQLVRGDLNAYRFSAAWSKLNAHLEVLMSHLSALSFDPNLSMVEHVEHINSIADSVMQCCGAPVSDLLLRGYLLGFLRCSVVVDVLKWTIEVLRLSEYSYADVCDSMIGLWNEHEQREMNFDIQHTEVKAHVSQAEFKLRCRNCRKHHAGKCTRGIVCHHCEKEGHMRKDCPQLKGNRGNGAGGGGGAGASTREDRGDGNGDGNLGKAVVAGKFKKGTAYSDSFFDSVVYSSTVNHTDPQRPPHPLCCNKRVVTAQSVLIQDLRRHRR